MRALCCLLLAACLLLSHVDPGTGQMTSLGRRSDHYRCAKRGGTCNLSPCPLFTRAEGTCYGGKAKCCMP